MGFLTKKEQEFIKTIASFNTSNEKIIDLHQDYCDILTESYQINRKCKKNLLSFSNLIFNTLRTYFSKKEFLKNNEVLGGGNLFIYTEQNVSFYFSYKKRNLFIKGITFKLNEKEFFLSQGQLLEFNKDGSVLLYDIYNELKTFTFKLVSFFDKTIYTKETDELFILYSLNGKTEINKKINAKSIFGFKYNYFNQLNSVYFNLSKNHEFFSVNDVEFYLNQKETLDINIDKKHNDDFLNICLEKSFTPMSNYYYSRKILKPTYSIKTNKKFFEEQVEILKMNYTV